MAEKKNSFTFKVWLVEFISFLIAVICSPFILIITSLTILCRCVVSLIFSTFYRGRYKLMTGPDAAYATETFASPTTVYFLAFIKGHPSLESIRQRMMKKLILYDDNGYLPYSKLMYRQVKKFGFYCWEDKSDSFDINDHIRYCPGAEDPAKIYTERVMFEAIDRHLDYPLDDKIPKWELLVVPRCLAGNSKDVYLVLVLKIYHPYMDGVSVTQLMRNCISDKPHKLLYDTVNPPKPKKTLCDWLILLIKAFYFAPYSAFTLAFRNEFNIYERGKPLLGPKFFSRSRLRIPFVAVKKIRKMFQCTTTTLLNSAIIGAMRFAAERKGLEVPLSIYSGSTVAYVPYPNERPQNRFAVSFVRYPIHLKDPLKRLAAMNRNSRKEHEDWYKIMAFYWGTYLMGLFPYVMVKLMWDSAQSPFVMTNVSGVNEQMEMDGHPIDSVYICPPITNGIGYTYGIISYAGHLHVSFFVEKSPVITSREDLDELIKAFERELMFYESQAIVKSKPSTISELTRVSISEY